MAGCSDFNGDTVEVVVIDAQAEQAGWWPAAVVTVSEVPQIGEIERERKREMGMRQEDKNS